MPHLHIEDFKNLNFPVDDGTFRFNFLAKNINHPEEQLIAAEAEGEEFFLLSIQDEGKSLLKTDKLTRPSSTYLVHQALLSYAKDSGMNVIASNVIDGKKNIHLNNVTALKDIEYFASNFPQDKEVRIEVGFGSGRHILHQAKSNPDILFIGIEIHRPSIEQVLKQISINKLDNLLLLDYDARLFLEQVPSNIVGRIYVHFPVPWDKKPHRRVISKKFLDEATRVLKVGGQLELRTDSENYYAYSYETFISRTKVKLQINKNQDIAIISKYEDRWRKMEKNIYDITMINEEESEPLQVQGNFDFDLVKTDFQALEKLNSAIKRFDEGFIHIERVYNIEDQNAILFRISMGSFDRPEHLYVLIGENETRYFPKPPLKSSANVKAHQILKEMLHG
ncbi:tRNA (guanosine(46)-N7)-methyltransferase TrmB [Sulfurimonas sp. HSL-1716]|uniref:tRNA (guanosine(46)-N7)-methyltransferase TrmB n=1 Tax=Hydrocurvibacter sulfurireducens TaxID=3131937 RepID=UPI0031F764AE